MKLYSANTAEKIMNLMIQKSEIKEEIKKLRKMTAREYYASLKSGLTSKSRQIEIYKNLISDIEDKIELLEAEEDFTVEPEYKGPSTSDFVDEKGEFDPLAFLTAFQESKE